MKAIGKKIVFSSIFMMIVIMISSCSTTKNCPTQDKHYWYRSQGQKAPKGYIQNKNMK